MRNAGGRGYSIERNCEIGVRWGLGRVNPVGFTGENNGSWLFGWRVNLSKICIHRAKVCSTFRNRFRKLKLFVIRFLSKERRLSLWRL